MSLLRLDLRTSAQFFRRVTEQSRHAYCATQRDAAAYHGLAHPAISVQSSQNNIRPEGSYGHGRSDAWRHERSKACDRPMR